MIKKSEATFVEFIPLTNGGFTGSFDPEDYEIVRHVGVAIDGLEIFVCNAYEGSAVCIFKGKFKNKTYSTT